MIKRSGDIPTIYGNYDYAIARDLDDCGCAYVTPHDRELGQRSVEWTLEHTDRAANSSCRGCRSTCAFGSKLTRPPRAGSPRKVNEYLFEDKPDSLYERLAAAEEDAVLAFGHTHKPWVREHGGVLFVNCGSVGKPKDGDLRAAFANLDPLATGDRIEASIERVPLRRRDGRARGSGLPGSRPSSPTSWSSPPENRPRLPPNERGA